MKLVIVNGRAATGKTTLARKLAADCDLILIAKDDIKEFLFDKLGSFDREWSRVIGAATSDFMYILADNILSYGRSVMLESAFYADFARPQFEKLAVKRGVEVIEIYCETDRAIRKQRFIERNESGQRHKGHFDETNYADLNTSEEPPHEPIGCGKVIRVNTGVPSAIDVQKLQRILKVNNSAQKDKSKVAANGQYGKHQQGHKQFGPDAAAVVGGMSRGF